MSVVYSQNERKFILTTDHTAYCLAIDPQDNLQHLYWGKKLLSEQDYPDCRPLGQTVGIGKNGENPRGLSSTDYFYPYEANQAVINEEFSAWGD